jgi:hypothetical protein
MSNHSPSLGVLFDRESLRVPELLAAASTAMRRGAQAKADAISPAFWLASAHRVVDLVEKVTDIPLGDVLVGAWKVHQQFAKYTDSAQYPPEKVSCVELLTHHIKSKYEPYIELLLDGKSAGRIEFALELDVSLLAGILVIQDKRIRRLEPGKCNVTGTLACEGQQITQRKSRDFSWSDGIAFEGEDGKGIPITSVI